MKKLHNIIALLVIIIFILLLQVFAGPYISAKISTLPLVRKYNLLRPQAPIVINTTNEVRVNDAEDAVAAFGKVKSKLSAVLKEDNSQAQLVASAINISGDGVFATTKLAIGNTQASSLALKLANGSVVRVDKVVLDPATNVVLLQTKARDVSPAAFADSLIAAPGSRVVLAAATDNRSPYFLDSFITLQENVSGVVFAGSPSRQFGLQNPQGLIPGQAIVNFDGEVLGLWDGSTVIPSSVLKTVVENYFAHGGSMVRPTFGFYYRFVSDAEGALLGSGMGARLVKPQDTVPAVVQGSPAEKAGLKAGDIITAVNNNKITESQQLELHLERLAPGSTATLTVQRSNGTVTLTIRAGQF